MKKAIYAQKIGMTQLIDESGDVIPITVLQSYENIILDKKTTEKHGYEAVIVSFGIVREKHVNKPKAGLFKKLNKDQKKYIRELRFEDIESLSELDTIALSQFEEKEAVNVTSISKGKGFQGTVKTHGFSRGPMTHGSKNHRKPGSIGAGTDPARVFKGTKMGRRKGNAQITIKNLEVVKIIEDDNLIYIKGSVPGNKKSVVLIHN